MGAEEKYEEDFEEEPKSSLTPQEVFDLLHENKLLRDEVDGLRGVIEHLTRENEKLGTTSPRKARSDRRGA